MNIVEIKLALIEKINSLEPSKFNDLYGIIMNYINGESDIEAEWNMLSEEQKKGINHAINEIDSGNQIHHENVISKYRNKYNNVK